MASSGMAIDPASWRRTATGYEGTVFLLPDRGYNVEGTTDYRSRLNIVKVVLTPADAGATPSADTQQTGVAANLRAHPARRKRFAEAVPIVDRDRHEGRAARLLHRRVIGAGDRRRDILRPCRLAAPFDIRAREFRRLFRKQKRFERQDRAGLLARRDDQRRLVLVGGEDGPQGMAETGG